MINQWNGLFYHCLFLLCFVVFLLKFLRNYTKNTGKNFWKCAKNPMKYLENIYKQLTFWLHWQFQHNNVKQKYCKQLFMIHFYSISIPINIIHNHYWSLSFSLSLSWPVIGPEHGSDWWRNTCLNTWNVSHNISANGIVLLTPDLWPLTL